LNRGILTLAYGSPEFLRMAKGMVRSARQYNSSCRIGIVTDSHDPDIHSLFDVVVPLDRRLGKGILHKLYLDRYTPFEKTIFVDSDCLFFDDPDLLWKMYEGSPGFGAKGKYVGPSDSHWAVIDLESYLRHFNVARIGLFNSGVFYFDCSDNAKKVFRTARDIFGQLDSLSLYQYKGRPSGDEPLFGMAMELCSVPLLPDHDGQCMTLACLVEEKELRVINVLRGQSRHEFSGAEFEPLLIHFNVGTQGSFVYQRELWRLRLGNTLGTTPMAGLLAFTMPRAAYYKARLRDRVGSHGLFGFVPERILNRLRRGRSG
jgi:hypothetical protein